MDFFSSHINTLIEKQTKFSWALHLKKKWFERDYNVEGGNRDVKRRDQKAEGLMKINLSFHLWVGEAFDSP